MLSFKRNHFFHGTLKRDLLKIDYSVCKIQMSFNLSLLVLLLFTSNSFTAKSLTLHYKFCTDQSIKVQILTAKQQQQQVSVAFYRRIEQRRLDSSIIVRQLQSRLIEKCFTPYREYFNLNKIRSFDPLPQIATKRI